jgi:hypothetical protein
VYTGYVREWLPLSQYSEDLWYCYRQSSDLFATLTQAAVQAVSDDGKVGDLFAPAKVAIVITGTLCARNYPFPVWIVSCCPRTQTTGRKTLGK